MRSAVQPAATGTILSKAALAVSRTRVSSSFNAALRAGTEAVQVHGGYGFSTEYPAERLFRDARALALMSGGTGALLRVSAGPILKEALPQADG